MLVEQHRLQLRTYPEALRSLAKDMEVHARVHAYSQPPHIHAGVTQGGFTSEVELVGAPGAQQPAPTVAHEPWRFLLARVPLPGSAPGSTGPAKLKRTEGREGPGVNVLVDLLRQDPHLGPFLAPASPEDPQGALAIPSKDNGLDIEGLAVHGDRVFLGLRGPVLRGHAVILELEVEDVGNGLLAPRRTKKGSAYHKHFLDLDGLGIRELCRHGEDLLILAGPTMPVDAPIRLFRLHKGLLLSGDTIHAQEKGVLEPLFDLKEESEEGNAEGVAVFSWFEPNDSVLVVYDTPSQERRYGPDGVLADVFRL